MVIPALIGLLSVVIAAQALRVQASSSRAAAATTEQSNELLIRSYATRVVDFEWSTEHLGANGLPTTLKTFQIENLNYAPVPGILLMVGVTFRPIYRTAVDLPALDQLSWQRAWCINVVPPCTIMNVDYLAHPLSNSANVYMFFQDPDYVGWVRSPYGTLWQIMPSAIDQVRLAAQSAPLFPLHDESIRPASGCSAG